MPALLGRLRRGAALALIALAACSSGAAGGPDGRLAASPECGLVRQDCAVGMKCAGDRCVPDGTEPLGAPCVDDAERVDTCRAGLRCSPLGVSTSPDGSEPRVCRALCAEDDACAGGERCTGTPTRPGVCVAPCTLFVGPCPEGRTCAYPYTGVGFSTCRSAGALAIGETCGDRADECPADAVCVTRTLGAPATCYRLCDTVDRGQGLRGCEAGGCVEAFGDRWVGICWP